MLRPAVVYALAATLAVVAADAVNRRWSGPPTEPPSRPARAVPRPAALAAGNDDFGHAPPLPVDAPATGVPAPGPAPAEPPADEAGPAEAGISPEDWKAPPAPNPDPSARPAIEDVWPARGQAGGGQRIRLRGRNLQPVYVLFGRSPARIVSVAEEGADVVLTLVAPPRTGPAQEWIVVANRDGSNAVAAKPFEYVP